MVLLLEDHHNKVIQLLISPLKSNPNTLTSTNNSFHYFSKKKNAYFFGLN